MSQWQKYFWRLKSDSHKVRDAGSSMKILFTIAVVALVTNSPSWSRADEQVRDASPDGKFAMLVTQPEEGGVKIQLIEVSSRMVVLDVAEISHFGPNAEDYQVLWAPDSQRFAFYEPNRRGGETTVYFRNESGFTESPMPELGSCATAAQKKELVNKVIESDTTPKEWLKSGALVVVNVHSWTTNNGIRSCTQTVTIGFEAKHKASVLRVTGKKAVVVGD
jgi:hypothetical protein